MRLQQTTLRLELTLQAIERSDVPSELSISPEAIS
jgi:hypothetical protein